MITTQQVFVLLRDGKLCGVFSTQDKAELTAYKMARHFDEALGKYAVLDTFLDEPLAEPR